jgi:predicted metal-dependent hydrolase
MSDDSSTRPTTRVVPKPRRVRFDMPAGTSRQHFVDGDLVMSHFVSTLSATFPEGEDFFIRSVREYRDHISDADLK